MLTRMLLITPFIPLILRGMVKERAWQSPGLLRLTKVSLAMTEGAVIASEANAERGNLHPQQPHLDCGACSERKWGI